MARRQLLAREALAPHYDPPTDEREIARHFTLLVRAFAEGIRDRYGVAVDAAIHAAHKYGDDRNHHAHVMTTTRVMDADKLGAKTRKLDVRSLASIEVEEIRARWAAQVDDALELAQVSERFDHRSYARQNVEWSLP